MKIALTATPALQTSEIFGEPVFKYTYREAVIEGYLVDHDAPHELKTKLNTEGIHYKNFFGTQVLGPILILNPLFLKYLLSLLGKKDKLYLEDLMIEAYDKRLKELEKPDKRFILKDHG